MSFVGILPQVMVIFAFHVWLKFVVTGYVENMVVEPRRKHLVIEAKTAVDHWLAAIFFYNQLRKFCQ